MIMKVKEAFFFFFLHKFEIIWFWLIGECWRIEECVTSSERDNY